MLMLEKRHTYTYFSEHTFPDEKNSLRRIYSFSKGHLLAIHICMHIYIHTCTNVYQTDHPTQFGTGITYMKNISSLGNTFSFEEAFAFDTHINMHAYI